MSLRGANEVSDEANSQQQGGCFATCARNDMQENALRELQSASGVLKDVLREEVALVLLVDVDIVPERSKWDAVRAG